MTAALEVAGLTKSYRGRAVVDGVSFAAHFGSITAVLGPNGAGKTTTIECCEGLRVPDGGRISVLGRDLSPTKDDAGSSHIGSALKELRPQVGVMLQDGGLPTPPKAMELLSYVASMYANPRPLGELAQRLGIDEFARTTVRRLSGGQRQRLALALAVVGRPRLVFLDEPSAGLDPHGRLAIWKLIRELRDGGTAVVLTTHLMEEAEQLADHMIVMHRGHVIAEGSPGDALGKDDDTSASMTDRYLALIDRAESAASELAS